MKKIVHRTYIVLSLFLLVSLETWAEDVYYASYQLQEIAEVLGINDTISKMPDGISRYNMKTSLPLTIEKRHGNVMHIGYALFSSNQKKSIGNARCYFIERYLLYTDLPLHREKPVEQEMKEEKIIFRTGSLSVLKSLIGDTVSVVDAQIYKNKAHIVRWTKSGKTICEVGFPIDHELMRGIRMKENDDRLQMDIKRTHFEGFYLTKPTKLSPLPKHDCLYTTQGNTFAGTSLLSNRYFYKKPDGSFIPVFDVDNITESISNLFTDNDIINNYMLEISQQQYNYHSKAFTVPLNQWTEYIKQEECILYFGIINKHDTRWECLLIAQHPYMGYCHLMRLQFDINTINSKEGMISARLNAFIPTSNIKDLNFNP